MLITTHNYIPNVTIRAHFWNFKLRRPRGDDAGNVPVIADGSDPPQKLSRSLGARIRTLIMPHFPKNTYCRGGNAEHDEYVFLFRPRAEGGVREIVPER